MTGVLIAVVIMALITGAALLIHVTDRRPVPDCRMCGGTGLTIGVPPCPCVRGEP